MRLANPVSTPFWVSDGVVRWGGCWVFILSWAARATAVWHSASQLMLGTQRGDMCWRRHYVQQTMIQQLHICCRSETFVLLLDLSQEDLNQRGILKFVCKHPVRWCHVCSTNIHPPTTRTPLGVQQFARDDWCCVKHFCKLPACQCSSRLTPGKKVWRRRLPCATAVWHPEKRCTDGGGFSYFGNQGYLEKLRQTVIFIF